MFDDPQVLIGMVVGIAIVVVGTTIGVREQRRGERAAASKAGEPR